MGQPALVWLRRQMSWVPAPAVSDLGMAAAGFSLPLRGHALTSCGVCLDGLKGGRRVGSG